MDIYTATMICEGVEKVDTPEEVIEAWQLLIDTGTCWELQGWFGRMAHMMIQEGHCTPASQ